MTFQEESEKEAQLFEDFIKTVKELEEKDGDSDNEGTL